MAQTVSLDSLNLEQLNRLKNQLEEEAQVLTSSFQQLKIAASRYFDAKECVKTLSNSTQGTTVLIPLTSSLFVPAELGDVSSVLLDIGTGYFTKQSIQGTQDFTDRKIKIINENLEKVQQALAMKRKNLETVLYVMQAKIAALEQADETSKKLK